MENSRYSCQMKLPEFGTSAQEELRTSKVLIVGIGGLGCPAAQYLAAAGIGKISLVDDDVVSGENLHRQILFTDRDIGQPKATAAVNRLQQQNPDISLEAIVERVDAANVMSLVEPYDVVLDCTDNFDSRYLLNDACVLAGKLLVYGAAYQYEGQVAVWNALCVDGTRSPNYRDVFPDADEGLSVDCSQGGVMPTLTGVIGCMQASEAIKYIARLPGLLASKLLTFDVRTMESRAVSLPKVSHTKIESLPQQMPTISTDALRGGMAENVFELIDVRDQSEHDKFNIGGRLIPLNKLLSGVIELPITKPIVFYCATGRRSQVAVRYFLDHHLGAKAWSLEGGVQAWQQSAAL